MSRSPAVRLGVEPLILMAQSFGDLDPTLYGLDGAFEFPPHKIASLAPEIAKRQHILDWSFGGQVFDFDAIADIALNEPTPSFELIKTVFPSWDNDARRQGAGLTVANSTPQSYERWLRRTIEVSRLRPFRGERYVFINAWNEWCEGAYLEPDVHFGSAYLNATARAVCRSLVSEGIRKAKVMLVGHDAFPAGAQLLLLNIARMFAESFGVETRVLLLGGGELLPSYEQVCPVTVCASQDAHEVVADLAAAGFELAITNTAASGWVVPALKDRGFTVLSLVHELPNLIQEYGLQEACRNIVIWRRDVLLDAFAGVGADLFDYRVAGDWRLYVEAANSPGSVAFCATPLNVHRRHARSVTRSLDERRHYEEICRVQNAAARYLGTDAELAAKIDAYRKEIREYFRIDEDAGWQVIKNAAI